jgi:AsmA protein
MRILKITAWLVGGLVALIAIGITLVVLFFNPNNYRADIEELVTKKTGRDFKLTGDLKLSVFPWLAVQVGPAALGNAPGYGDTPMVAINGAKLGVRLMPLLHSKVEIDAVELDAPRFVLIKNADGGNNWSDLLKTNDAEKNNDESSSGKLNASVASVTIKKGSLSYDDRTAQVVTSLHDFNLNTGALESGKPVDLKSSFTLERGKDLQLDTELTASVTADLDASRYRLDKPEIKLKLRGAGYPKEGLPVHIKSSGITADLAAQTAQIAALAIEAAGANVSGELSATQVLDAPHITGNIKLAQVSPREIAPKFGINLPVTADSKVLQRFSFEGALDATTKAFAVTNMTLHLDESTMTGSAGIADLASKALRFNLAIDRINVDRYLPPAAPEASSKAAASADAAPTPIPVDTIRGLNLHGALAINDVTFKNMQLSKVSAGINAVSGKLQLDPLQASLYEGKYHGNVVIDAAGKLPTLSLDQHLENINFAPILEALYKTKRLSGHGTLNMKLAGSGADTDAIKRTVDGTLDFSVTNGTVNGFDLWYEIRRARALLKLDTQLRLSLPESVRRHCCLADVRAGRVVFLADSSTWAAKLRLHQSVILAEAQKALGQEVKSFTVKVAPLPSVPPEPARRKPLSSAAAAHLSAAAVTLADPELRALFLRLASLAGISDSEDTVD